MISRPKPLAFNSGFMLLEAILTLVIVSISLAFIVQALLTNFRTGVRFQEAVRSLIVMENKLGLLFATSASDDLLLTYPQTIEEPYEKFTFTAHPTAVNDHLKKVGLQLNWPQGNAQGRLDITTIVYNANEN